MELRFYVSLITALLVTGVFSQEKAFALNLRATSALPISHLDTDLSGTEATNVRTSGVMAYVTYNTADSGSLGAFEAIDLSDIQHPHAFKPLKYNDFEFADLAIDGDRAYIVGQENTPSHQGAVLKMIDISMPDHLSDLGSLPLDGFAATSIRIEGCEAVVSTGDNAGIVILDLHLFGMPSVRKEIPFSNALSASIHSNQYFALGGVGSTQFASFDPHSLTELHSLQISSQTTPSPARFQIRGNTAYINTEKSGLSLIDLEHFGLLSGLALPGTGNGLDVLGDLVFLAQGEAGLVIVDAKDKRSPQLVANLDFHYPGESTNQVRYYEDPNGYGVSDYLLVANGRGGLRIFNLSGLL